MAQKRMFDRAIIDTDKFMDLPMSAKAMYFLLGMEADDEGFVSYKKVLRIHGGNEDDVKLLIAKNFLIHFPSGVVVITDWNSNNYMDKNRIKPTEYQLEKSQLVLTSNKKYGFNNGSTSIEESSVVESISEASSQKYEIVHEDDSPRREKKVNKAEQVYTFFKEEVNKYPLNWKTNKTQRLAAENLLQERGEEQIRKALRFWLEYKEQPFCPEVSTPWDLDSKWTKLLAFKEKYGH